jgi:hypothetical protein
VPLTWLAGVRRELAAGTSSSHCSDVEVPTTWLSLQGRKGGRLAGADGFAGTWDERRWRLEPGGAGLLVEAGN